MKKELLNQLRLERIEVYEQACLNFANKNSFCSDCEESCPVSAIKIEDQVPIINQGKCIDCGACISKCSVFAIDHVQIPYQEITREIGDHTSANITCKEYEEYQKGIKVPCYLYLDMPLLLQLNDRKELILYTGQCDRCEKNEFVDIDNHIANLQKQLEEIQSPLKVKLQEKEFDQFNNDQVVKGISRRELLGMLSFKNLKQMLFSEEEESKEEQEQDLKPISLRERILFKRNQFNHFIKVSDFTHTKKPLPENYFLKIDPVDQCRGCDICQQICPTKAIHWVDDESNGYGVSKLHFTLQACVGCRKCAVCPDQAIQFNPINLIEYQQKNEIILKTLNLKKCDECGETFRTNKEVSLCEFCEANKQKDPSRFFA